MLILLRTFFLACSVVYKESFVLLFFGGEYSWKKKGTDLLARKTPPEATFDRLVSLSLALTVRFSWLLLLFL